MVTQQQRRQQRRQRRRQRRRQQRWRQQTSAVKLNQPGRATHTVPK
jgi:hypothetical protein